MEVPSDKGGCTHLWEVLADTLWRDVLGNQPVFSCETLWGKILQVCGRKYNSPEHLACFYLVDMLNLINDCISFFILAMRKLERNSVIMWSTFVSIHTTLGINTLYPTYSS